MKHKFSMPLRINKNKVKVKWFYLNLNSLIQISRCPPARNAVKQKFTEGMRPMLENHPAIKSPVEITFTIWAKDKRLFDVDNVGSVACKFFQDALVYYGIIEDDNYKHIQKVIYMFGGIDKENPRADVEIESLA